MIVESDPFENSLLNASSAVYRDSLVGDLLRDLVLRLDQLKH